MRKIRRKQKDLQRGKEEERKEKVLITSKNISNVSKKQTKRRCFNWFKLNNIKFLIFNCYETMRWLIEWYDQNDSNSKMWLRKKVELNALINLIKKL